MFMLDSIALFAVTLAAKKLNVIHGISAAFCDWDDVIEFQIDIRIAFDAGGTVSDPHRVADFF